MEQTKNNLAGRWHGDAFPSSTSSGPDAKAHPSDRLADTQLHNPRLIPQHRAPRSDGWTPERIRTFLDILAQCGVVADAARAAGLSVQSAYRFRNSARGRAFDVAWRAALLVARRRLADEVMSRALNGCVEVIVRDGEVWGERHRYDNRLTMAVLARLDALAEGGRQLDDVPRRVAHEFEQLVDAVCRGGEAATAFIGSRSALRYRDYDEGEILSRNQDYAEGRDCREGEGPDEWRP